MSAYPSTVVLGTKGSGKTTLVKRLIRETPHIILDPLWEYGSSYNVGPADPTKFIELVRRSGARTVVFEEASRYVGKKNTNESVRVYFDEHRHYMQRAVAVCRRPTQLHPDVLELAEFIVIFNLPGANDRGILESMATGLGDVVRGLGDHEYCVLNEKRIIHISPAPELKRMISRGFSNG